MDIKENPEEKERTETEETLPRKLKKVADLDVNEKLEKVFIGFGEKQLKALKQFALDKDVSRGVVVRRSVKEYLEKNIKSETEKPEKTETTIPNAELDKIISENESFYGIFNLDQFLRDFKAKGYKFSELNEQQSIATCMWIKRGYYAYEEKPEPLEFMKSLVEFDLTDKQYSLLSLFIEYDVTVDQEDTEKTIDNLIKEIKGEIESENEEEKEATGEKALESEKPSETESSEEWKKANVG